MELLAKAQLKGRLVIMAMSHTNLTGSDCLIDKLSAYARFEPKRAHLDSPAKEHQIFYAKLKQNQLPSMFIQSLRMLNGSDRLSITLDVNQHKTRGRTRGQQEIVTRETLLVSELICSNNSSSADNEDQRQAFKINLLALINRDSAATAASSPQATQASTIASPTTTAPAQVASEQPQTTGQSRRAILVDSASTLSSFETPTQTSSKRNSSMSTGAFTPKLGSTESINQRMDHLAPTNSVLFQLNHQDQHQSNSFQRFLQFNSNEFDSLKLKLKSNSLLMFTVTSCFVILTYTLCLLIYLRSRQRSRAAQTQRQQQPLQKPGTKGDLQQQQPPTGLMDISGPFNLQMPSATRTRLNMMLGSSAANNRHHKRRKTKRRSSNSPAADDGMSCDGRYSNIGCLVQSAEFGPPKGIPNYHVRFANNVSNRHLSYDDLQNANYGSVNVVRAIREAATMAKTKFRTSSFKPNLNVIPETDLEHLQQASPIQEFFVDFSHEYDDDELNNNNTCISLEQIDSLVQEAMSRECSHIVEKVYNDSYQETLFSKPKERPVSRSKILQQVSTKRENIYEENNI